MWPTSWRCNCEFSLSIPSIPFHWWEKNAQSPLLTRINCDHMRMYSFASNPRTENRKATKTKTNAILSQCKRMVNGQNYSLFGAEGEQLDFTNTHIRLATNKVKLLQLRGKERVRTKTPLVGLEFVHFFSSFSFQRQQITFSFYLEAVWRRILVLPISCFSWIIKVLLSRTSKKVQKDGWDIWIEATGGREKESIKHLVLVKDFWAFYFGRQVRL